MVSIHPSFIYFYKNNTLLFLLGNIHPRDKQGLGYRSYLLAQTYVYGESNVIYSGTLVISIFD